MMVANEQKYKRGSDSTAILFSKDEKGKLQTFRYTQNQRRVETRIKKYNNEIKDKADLIAVSKTRSVEQITEAYNQGQKKFGENNKKLLLK